MRDLCTQCKKIYKLPDKILLPNKLLIPVILLVISTVLIRDQFRYSFNLIFTLIALIAIIAGVIIWLRIYKDQWNCIKCDGKRTLLKYNSPEAIEIIRDNNLSIPEESPEDSKFPWQSS